MALRPQRTLSLCTGIGGLDLGVDAGLARVGCGGARPVCLVEGEAYAAATLVKAMSKGWLDQAPIWSDVRTFDALPWRGRVDGVVGGFPCQPFSVAGKMRREHDERHLWPAIRDILAVLEPHWCFFENVSALLSGGGHTVLGELQALGFRTAASLWTAQEVGAPHKRERLFILGVRDVPNADGFSLRDVPERPARGRDHLQAGRQALATAHGTDGLVANANGIHGDTRRTDHALESTARRNTHGGTECTPLANAEGQRLQTQRRPWRSGAGFTGPSSEGQDGGGAGPLGHTDRGGQLRLGFAEQGCWQVEGWRWPCHPSWWTIEPDVGRVVDGAPHGMDRVRALGNAVVPEQAAQAFEELFRALMG